MIFFYLKMEFTVFLSNNNNSKDRYENSYSSEFTNNIYPPINFDNNYIWTVACKSCILPFVGDFKFSVDKEEINKKVYSFSWEVFKRYPPEDGEIKKLFTVIKMKGSELLHKTPKEIFNIMMKKSLDKVQLHDHFIRIIFRLTENKIHLTHILSRPDLAMEIKKDV